MSTNEDAGDTAADERGTEGRAEIDDREGPTSGAGRGRRGPGSDGTAAPAETPNTLLNAVIGGVTTAATTMFLGPLSPVVGGGVAGYLEGGENAQGMKVGAFAGLVALVPLLLFLPLLLFVVPVMGPRGGIAFVFVLLFVLSLMGAYVVGFSALGGLLGAYLKRERRRPDRHSRDRR